MSQEEIGGFAGPPCDSELERNFQSLDEPDVERNAQSLGVDTLSDFVAEQSCAVASRVRGDKRGQSRAPKEFSNGFESRLDSFIPQGLETEFFHQGNALCCRIDLSSLSAQDRMAFAAQLMELEETDKSIRSLRFENNYATLVGCLSSKVKHEK